MRSQIAIACLLVTIPVSADHPIDWVTVATESKSTNVRLRSPLGSGVTAGKPTFVISHGMYGTAFGDRFHQLAEAISHTRPAANVLLIDWSPAACTKSRFLGITTPYAVAGQIDRVADEAAAMIKELDIEIENTTLIGESFGNWINAGITRRLGAAHWLLAMNPASEYAGYAPPDLRNSARITWSFHTFSAFDTLHSIAHVSVFLETPVDADDVRQHTSGIRRLTASLLEGKDHWLLAKDALDSAREVGKFDYRATIDGRFLATDLPKRRPVPQRFVAKDQEQCERKDLNNQLARN